MDIDLDTDTNILNIKYKRITLVLCIKQHLSNIWNSIDRKAKQHCRWVEKELLIKKACSIKL